MNFGERLKLMLKEKNMSQKDLATKAGRTEAAISRYIKGTRVPSAMTLKVIAEALQCSVADLMEEPRLYFGLFKEGYDKGMRDAVMMREDADGCVGCAFRDRDSWEMPCDKCKRNCKDYWRVEKV